MEVALRAVIIIVSADGSEEIGVVVPFSCSCSWRGKSAANASVIQDLPFEKFNFGYSTSSMYEVGGWERPSGNCVISRVGMLLSAMTGILGEGVGRVQLVSAWGWKVHESHETLTEGFPSMVVSQPGISQKV